MKQIITENKFGLTYDKLITPSNIIDELIKKVQKEQERVFTLRLEQWPSLQLKVRLPKEK